MVVILVRADGPHCRCHELFTEFPLFCLSSDSPWFFLSVDSLGEDL
jgi:hypothetical protein